MPTSPYCWLSKLHVDFVQCSALFVGLNGLYVDYYLIVYWTKWVVCRLLPHCLLG